MHAGMHVRANPHVFVCAGVCTQSYSHAGNQWARFPADAVGSCSSLPRGEGCGLNLSFAQALVSMSSGGWGISEVPLFLPLLNFIMF